MPFPLFCLSDLVLPVATTSILTLTRQCWPNLTTLWLCNSNRRWQLLPSTTLRVRKEKLWLQSVFYARNLGLSSVTEVPGSLHPRLRALAASRSSSWPSFQSLRQCWCPGWRNSSAWKTLLVRDVSHWHKVLNSGSANVDAAEGASASQGWDKALSSLPWLQ